MFSEKAPFGIPNLYNASLRSELRKIAAGKTFIVTPDENRKILDTVVSVRDSYIVVATILMLIDENASHSLPVFKLLVILMNGLHQNRYEFVEAAKTFSKEIRSILFLNFGDPADIYREQIHYMIQAIYHHIVYSTKLPTVESCTKASQLPEPPKSPQSSKDGVVAPKEPEEEDDEELSFDLKSMSNDRSLKNSFNPFSSTHDLISFGQPQQNITQDPFVPPPEIIPEKNIDQVLISSIKVQEEEKPTEGLKNPRDLYLVTEFQLEKRPQYDDTIESY
ncbi:hypothetical protein TVAG_342400 [Trichomonas vaginalis G3]|uniref:Uncharacterized protein n=1 Tax=Trichomonas vaginalis (strain ATCC PRA-98 / G3) TaxID=412133 RepID=A2FME8_TRIV3|nr:hypothetical protein TVAGG3_0590100 [Trichomonas vaginalis G3]EAX93923.1 hypothetical protein TVAG_342400 [Trichomonas vaginalis G3]KAI5523188.1 hypothetical protein TVAGG3_0590100 [Trichomonas vaginalis G3]|eukprot:XP_001306853.1 hypothetical protein [Trichomonas vaginalis G3]